MGLASNVDFNLSYTIDTHYLKKSNTSGRLENIGLLIGGTEFSFGNLELHGSLMLNHSTGSPTDSYLSDIQVTSNIDTQGGEGIKPYELYLGYSFSNGTLIKGGLQDLSLFINVTESSALHGRQWVS